MNTQESPLLTSEQVAHRLNIPVSTLVYWRHTGRGPAFVPVGRLVRYRPSEIDRWIEAQTRKGWR